MKVKNYFNNINSASAKVRGFGEQELKALTQPQLDTLLNEATLMLANSATYREGVRLGKAVAEYFPVGQLVKVGDNTIDPDMFFKL